MKVLFVATVTEHIKAFHIPYLKWFKEQGWEVHVATYGNENVPYCDKKYNITVQRSPFKIFNINAYFQLKAILKAEKYDIIHGHTPMGGILARLCGKRYRKNGTKIIYTAHGFHFYKGVPLINWLLYYPIEKWLSRYTDTLITMNNEDYQLAQKKMRAKKIEYIPGIGVDIKKFSSPSVARDSKRRELGLPLNADVIISVGELNKNKNHKTIIRAVSKIKSSNMYYIICGQGNLNEYLQNLCNQLELNNRVIFLGYRNNIADWLNMSDIFILPSLREGLPVAMVEAMAAGLPCVASKIRGNIDLIEHGKSGFLCAADNANEYVNAITNIINDRDLKSSMGEYNRNAVQKFDLSVVTERMKEIYGESFNGI